MTENFFTPAGASWQPQVTLLTPTRNATHRLLLRASTAKTMEVFHG
jgi:hypothetical protein